MKRFIWLIFLWWLHASLFADRRVSTIIIPHSVSVNAARELAGWEHQVNIYSPDGYYGSVAINPEVTLSFRPERIAQCLFGDAIVECKNTFTVSGSRTENRTKSQWLADYFGLPTDFKSHVHIEPRVNNVLIDIDLFLGLDKWVPGLYFRIHAPLTYTRWNLGLCETLVTTGSNAHDPGYFNATGIPREQLATSFSAFISGCDIPKATGLTFNPLTNAKMSKTSLRLIRLSDIQMALGWNVLHQPRYHLGGNIRMAIPTGNRPDGAFLFEPIIGNGHHWELGGGLSAHITLWEDEMTEEQAGIYFDGNITHMFTSRQCRPFDLCNDAFNSRYMLAERMTSPITQGLRGTVDGVLIEPIAQFNQEVTTVANLTTIPVDVSSNVQADLAVMITYTKAKNSWGLGYGFWGRSCETITLCPLVPFDIASWALKGDAMVFGFEDTGLATPVALSATQSQATVNHGLDFAPTGAVTPSQINQGKQNLTIDNAVPASADSNGDGIFVPLLSIPGGADRIHTSIQPVLLTKDDIDINSGRTQGRAHKIFSHFTHTIMLSDCRPYLSIGAEIEFGQGASCSKVVKLNELSCVNTALSFWGVWLKSGVAF